MGRRDLSVYRCDRCRHAFVIDRSQEEVNDFHDGEYRLKYYRDETERASNAAGVIDERFHQVRERFTLGRWERIGAYFRPHHQVLDVGCGAGSFARHLAPHVSGVDGLELSSWFVDYINERLPVTAFRCALEAYRTEKRYDVIVTWHCMEHTVCVDDFLRRAWELLVPAGLLFLEVPTINDWNDPPSGGFFNDSHVHYFSPRSLDVMVSRYFTIFRTWPGLQPPATMLAAKRRPDTLMPDDSRT